MDTVAPERQVVSGWIALPGGGNDAVDPILVADTEFSRGVNVSIRKGLVTTRPAFTRIAALSDGPFQGANDYRLNDFDRLACVIGGSAYALRLDDLQIETWKTGAFKNAVPVYFCRPQCDRFCIMQDDDSAPLIMDQTTVVSDEAVPAGTLKADGSAMTGTYGFNFPKGSVMAFGYGRIFMVAKVTYDNNGNATSETGKPYWIASNIFLSYRPKNTLLWTETDYLTEGGSIGNPQEFGFIKDMNFLRNAQNAEGLGQLLAFGRDGIGAFQVGVARTAWKNTTNFRQILFANSGTFSCSSLAVNDDIFYRGGRKGDGLRSIRYTTRDVASASGLFSNAPISSEVKYLTDLDEDEDLPHVSMINVNDRIYMTTGGRNADGGFKALVVLDSNVSNRIKERSPPVYNGAWTGLHFSKLVQARYQGVESAFVFAKRNTVGNEVWMVDEAANKDNGTTPILCRLYTKAMTFANPNIGVKPQDRKQFHYLDLWVKDINGDCVVTLYYRPYGYPLWTKGSTTTIKADGLQQFRDPIRLSTTGEETNQVTGDATRVASVFEFCIQWTGRLTIQEALFVCSRFNIDDDQAVGNTEVSAVTIEETENQVILNDFEYEIE